MNEINSIMDCSKVYVKDAGNLKGVGVFAK
jgi:hypothetical protein